MSGAIWFLGLLTLLGIGAAALYAAFAFSVTLAWGARRAWRIQHETTYPHHGAVAFIGLTLFCMTQPGWANAMLYDKSVRLSTAPKP